MFLGSTAILDETGNNLGDHTWMNQQVQDFADAIQQMRRYVKGDNSSFVNYLSKCVIYSGLGSNNYLNNYFMPSFYTTSSDFTPKAYAAALLNDYSRQLNVIPRLPQVLPCLGFVVIFSLLCRSNCLAWELGSHSDSGWAERLHPYQVAQYTGNSSQCNEGINSAIRLFNSGIRKMVDLFNNGLLLVAKFVFLNSYGSTEDIYVNTANYGFQVIDKGCCEVGKNNGQTTCLPLQQAFPDRTKYLFWDA